MSQLLQEQEKQLLMKRARPLEPSDDEVEIISVSEASFFGYWWKQLKNHMCDLDRVCQSGEV